MFKISFDGHVLSCVYADRDAAWRGVHELVEELFIEVDINDVDRAAEYREELTHYDVVAC